MVPSIPPAMTVLLVVDSGDPEICPLVVVVPVQWLPRVFFDGVTFEKSCDFTLSNLTSDFVLLVFSDFFF